MEKMASSPEFARRKAARNADAYLFALPHTALAQLLPESVKQSDPSLANLDKNQSRADHRRAFLV